ncbi:Ubiquinone/menaquinone biosynthesis C-methyltransferase UbiE [Micromonospora sp. MH33]|nr:Ubiquinone/menaquinone biosynthesis C-methyltransferase UbiE [Micromonospora sp. MH33]
MSTPTAPFTDTKLVRSSLYATADRIEQRTSALHRAKITGADAAATIAALAAAAHPNPSRVADIGCGRGTTTIRLAHQYPAATIVAVDQSPALLAVTGNRLRAQRREVTLVAADFHHLRGVLAHVDVAAAAFCLYHSRHPEKALAEIGACLAPGAHLIAATKSADSYINIDRVIAASGLDREAVSRPSLYEAFHTSNAEAALAAAGFILRRRVDQQHTFRFTDLAHLAEYAVTSPKYRLPSKLTADPAALAAALRARLSDEPITAASTVTYLVATRP